MVQEFKKLIADILIGWAFQLDPFRFIGKEAVADVLIKKYKHLFARERDYQNGNDESEAATREEKELIRALGIIFKDLRKYGK